MGAMGAWFSRFRSHQTTKEQLEQIETEIQSIEDYKWSKLRQQKNLMALVFYGCGLLYAIVAILFYFCFLPLSYNLYDKCIYSLPLIVLPAIAYLLQRSMQGYFRWVLDNNEARLTELRKEKRKILDKVMDTETYKVAKELLEKYDPSSLKSERSETSPLRSMSPAAGNQSLRLRSSPTSPRNTPAARHFMNTSNPNLNASLSAITTQNPQNQQRPVQSQNVPAQMAYPANMHRGSLMLPPPAPPRLTRPVLPADRSLMEKMVDFVVGDGPNNRYALICCYCHSHNGMALKDEFEYLSFKCCYCNSYNPARKLRPFAPRIAAPPSQPVVEEPDSESEKSDKKQEETADSETQSEKETKRDSAKSGAEMTDDEDKDSSGDEKKQKLADDREEL